MTTSKKYWKCAKKLVRNKNKFWTSRWISLELNKDASTNNIFPERSRTFSVSELLFFVSLVLFVCLFVCLYLHSCFFSYVRIDFNKHNASPTPPGGEISNSATLKMVRDMDQKKDMMQSNHEPSGITLFWLVEGQNNFWNKILF